MVYVSYQRQQQKKVLIYLYLDENCPWLTRSCKNYATFSKNSCIPSIHLYQLQYNRIIYPTDELLPIVSFFATIYVKCFCILLALLLFFKDELIYFCSSGRNIFRFKPISFNVHFLPLTIFRSNWMKYKAALYKLIKHEFLFDAFNR